MLHRSAQGGTEFQVTLDRPDDTTASDNTGLLPDPFTLDKPTPDLSRKDDDLTLSWSPADSGERMTVDIDGKCIFSFGDSDVSDTGSFDVAAGKLESTGGDMPETCDLTAKVTRVSEGSADTLFDPESYFRLHQRRSARVTSNP
jgi:hypothetical protein